MGKDFEIDDNASVASRASKSSARSKGSSVHYRGDELTWDELENALLRLGRWQDVRLSGFWMMFLGLTHAIISYFSLSAMTALSFLALFRIWGAQLLRIAEPWLEANDLSVTPLYAWRDKQLKRGFLGASTIARNLVVSFDELLESDDSIKHIKLCSGLFSLGLLNLAFKLDRLMFFFGVSVLIFPLAFDRLNDPLPKKYLAWMAERAANASRRFQVA